jgi:hypothetical protein
MKARLFLTIGLTSLVASISSAQLTEPDTVFYGKVLHHGGGEPQILTAGNLAWRVVPPGGGAAFIVKADLTSWENGQFSYSIRIPRKIAISGVPEYSVSAGLPVLADTTLRYSHADITVNGQAARLADPAALSFAADGTSRADFNRLDLIVDYSLPDTDGDGLPDWWETKYGLDLQNGVAGADTDGDGITDLAEYRAGTNPSLAGTAPQLAAETSLTIPENGRAALLLQAQDSDTPPALLRYTVQTLPADVSVSVRDGQADGRSDRPIVAGGTFTQAEVNAGRVIFAAAGNVTNAAANISLVDEMPARPAVSTSVKFSTVRRADLLAAASLREAGVPSGLILHYGASSAKSLTLRSPSGPVETNAALSTAAYANTWTPQHGADEARLFIGSPLNDNLLGSGEADVLAAGGGTNILRGYAGADRFIFTTAGAQDTVSDFTSSERDVLDVSALLTSVAGRTLGAYLSLQPGPVLRVDANGDGSGYTDAAITLTNAQMPMVLDEAWDAGLIDTGTIVPRTTLFVTATSAAEEGLAAGTVSFRRRGDATSSLTVPLRISGTATAGVDYVSLPSSITFAAGEKTAQLSITPLTDDLREPIETLEIGMLTSPSYDLGTTTVTANLTDLPSRVWIEVVERAAFKDSLSPAQVLIRRSGTLSAPLTALIQTSGRATPAVDYRRPSSSFTFSAWQDVIAVDILPLSTATLTGGTEDVILNVKADAAYQFGITPQARLVICQRPQTLAAWRTARQPGNDPEDESFYAADPDGDGFNGLMEFALNLNPNASDSGDKTQTKLVFSAAGTPGLEFRRWPAAPEVRYEVWQSSDLKNWQLLTTANSAETSTVLEADGMERVCHCLQAKPAGGSVYLRLKISRTN